MARSKRELAVFLSKLKSFRQPNRSFEQYPTDSDVAATLLWKAHLDGTINGKTIVDLGCGTGILTVGALILGARKVIMIDIDKNVQTDIEKNLDILEESYEIQPYDHVEMKFEDANTTTIDCEKDETTILMNPPFGTSVKHADTMFLQKAFTIGKTIYSIHKTSTRNYIISFCQQRKHHIKWEQDISFMIKNTMKEHRKHIQRIDTTLFKIE
ncbi:MAG: METTL5 family protein [Nanobdellota archaeon]